MRTTAHTTNPLSDEPRLEALPLPLATSALTELIDFLPPAAVPSNASPSPTIWISTPPPQA
eukprot:5807304-Pleurochrysis_carterae.AAC.1